jgi:hypothetical protein
MSEQTEPIPKDHSLTEHEFLPQLFWGVMNVFLKEGGQTLLVNSTNTSSVPAF